jgi:hypothetical protein
MTSRTPSWLQRIHALRITLDLDRVRVRRRRAVGDQQQLVTVEPGRRGALLRELCAGCPATDRDLELDRNQVVASTARAPGRVTTADSFSPPSA